MHFDTPTKSKLRVETGLFPFVQMSNTDSTNLQTKLKEVKTRLNDISSYLSIFEEKAEIKEKKHKLTRKVTISPVLKQSILKTPPKLLNLKSRDSVDFFSPSAQLSLIRRQRDIQTTQDKSFEIFLQNSPVNKLRKFSSDKGSNMSNMTPKASFYKLNSSKLQCQKTANNSKYQALEKSINEIMSTCKKHNKSISMDRIVIPDEKKPMMKGRFPEIDFIKNIVDTKNKAKPTGVFIRSGKDRSKYISLDKNNIFQMYHYANVINPEQGFKNKEMYMTKFGMLKNVCEIQDKVLFIPKYSVRIKEPRGISRGKI
jgi:hypothetical protein